MAGPNPFTEPIVRQHFDGIAASYDRTVGARRATFNRAVDEIVFEEISRCAAPLILDAGCGAAARSAALKQRLPSARVCGIDASANMIAVVQSRGLDDVRVCRIEEADYPDKMFDFVSCLFFVICYLTSGPERARAVANRHRMLKPGALLFIDAINVWHLGEGMEFRCSLREAAWDFLRSVLDPRLGSGDEVFAIELDGRRLRGYHHAFSHGSLSRRVHGAGFVVVRRLTIGYNSGRPRRRPTQGQLFHV